MSPAPRRPTSSDVAARAGVSRATVSMVLNDRVEGTVASATRDRVLAAAAELGYARSAIALSLRDRRTRTIGLITDRIATSPWAGPMTRAASQEAAAHGQMVIEVDLSLREASLADAMRLLAERQVDGLVYATMGRARIRLPASTFGLPLVLLDCEEYTAAGADASADDRDRTPVPAFVPADLEGARRATRHLIGLGHERIAMLSGGDRQPATLEREQGYRTAMTEAGLAPRLVPAGWQMDDGFRAASRLLAHGQAPTALFCIRDRVAAGALHAAALAGVDVPGRLSVVGFDDEDFFAAALTPPLTTIALPHEEMGRAAVRALLDLIEGGEERAAVPSAPVVVPCALVERATTGLVPA
ncbi:LacI family DNA-binding transcriptional regulator [Brachybacterium huguangmaarense]|uniref:LacI family DNA-binding transcriptional regulator n=1 Tax=Brachybacterium huguangmaarense TaxID=1652028 RepID=A0ABY6G3Q5_9MICO|nr:LacI family DNA-binding transcriptional regulator [Brachybacterium huguangmaarense]UYG17742.1 LacI family DNA-binding transcriptional regulator [Brachybacterium huguangmaarense]